ncbi:MAG: hypothetical protein GEU28_09825 [Dehalococcoidia bacterium]|nr:hypothetical protein [Dehalococcoidia bacterium]
MIILLCISAAATVSLLIYAMLNRREDVFRERLRGISTYDPADTRVNRSLPFLERALYPTTESLLDAIISVTPTGLSGRIKRQLGMAGDKMTFRRFMGLWVVVTVAAAGAATFLLASSGMLGKSYGIPALLMAILVAAYLPHSFLKTGGQRRQKAIVKALPDGMDLITTSVEAGLGLDAALAKVAERSDTTLSQELGRALREMALGRTRREALEELGERTQVQELRTFIGAVIQAEQLGVSLAQVLRVQSDQLRVKRRQHAQELAMQAPVKMVFPLALGVFPTIMMIILAPAVLTFIQDGGITGG